MTPDNVVIDKEPDHIVTIIDGPVDAQAWLDVLIQSAQTGSGNFPHAHPNIPATRITLVDLWRAIETNYSAGGGPWRITALGFPQLEGGEASSMRAPGPSDDPNVGSAGHNVLHALLGNFH